MAFHFYKNHITPLWADVYGDVIVPAIYLFTKSLYRVNAAVLRQNDIGNKPI